MAQSMDISTLIENDFPSIYANTALLRFIEGYFEFLEQEGEVYDTYSNLPTSFDPDLSVDGYVNKLKNQWIPGIPSNTVVDGRRIVTASSELLAERGTPQSIIDLMKIIYDESADVVYPSKNIIRPSDSKWRVPEYIEAEYTDRLPNMLGKRIEGSISGASGYVEQIILKTINGAAVSVLYIVDTIGSFIYGDIITENKDVTGAPRVIGSLSSIKIINGGQGFVEGDLFDIETDRGILGKARADTIINATGRMTPIIIDGGTGYSQDVDINETLVATATLFVDDITNEDENVTEFVLDETVGIPYEDVSVISSTLDPSSGDTIYGNDGSSDVAEGIVVKNISDTITINTRVGTFEDASFLHVGDIASANAVVDTYEDVSLEGRLIGQNTTAIGVYANTSIVYDIDGTIIRGETSNTTATINRIATGSAGSFGIGLLEDTEFVSLYTDIIGQENTNDIEYNDIGLDGRGSGIGFLDSVTVDNGGTGYADTDTITVSGGNPTVPATVSANISGGIIQDVTITNAGEGYYDTATLTINTSTGSNGSVTPNMNYGYGFPKEPNGDDGTVMDVMLGFDRFTIGSISTLSRINTGDGYNANPFIYAKNPYIAGYNRRNIIATLDDITGIFSEGESLSQNVVEDGLRVTIDTITESVIIGDNIIQTSSGTTGKINSANTSHLEIDEVNGTFDGGLTFEVVSSGSDITASALEAISVIKNPKGTVIMQNGNDLYIKRESFNTSFSPNYRLEGDLSSASADVISTREDPDSTIMGHDAVITANVVVASGVVDTASIVSSGFGYIDQDEVVLVNKDSAFLSSGIIGVKDHGQGEGYWKTRNAHFSTDNRLQDNDFWQTHSYVVRTGMALDKYSEVLKELVHVAGTKLFGEFVMTDDSDEKTKIEQFSIEIS